MKIRHLKLTCLAFGAITVIAAGGCRSTVRGVVSDTERNTQKVGQGVERVGEKIQETVR